LPAAKWTNARL